MSGVGQVLKRLFDYSRFLFQLQYIYHQRVWLVVHSVAFICVSVCPVCALTFESLYLETPFVLYR